MIKTDRSFGMYLLLSIVTCGIYPLIFFYNYTEDLNVICARDGKNTMNYLLMILLTLVTCGIYYYIWLYQVGNRLEDNSRAYGVAQNTNGTNLVLWSLLGAFIAVGPYIAIYKMIDSLNSLAYAYNNTHGNA